MGTIYFDEKHIFEFDRSASGRTKGKEDNMDYQYYNNEPEKKKSKFGWGIVTGVLGTVLAAGAALNVFCKTTGTTIYIMNASDASKPAITAADSDSTLLNEDTVKKINELGTYIDYYYYDDVEEQELRDGLYAGLLEGVGDKYSVYYNADEYADLQVSTTGQYYGIGAGLSQNKTTMEVTVNKIYEGTPSEAAGMKKDDVILSVDGTEATSMELTNLVKLIRGDEGTTVHIEIYRPSTEENLSFDVERADVTLPSVSSQMLENSIGYILIDSFETDTAKQFEQALADLQAQGMKSLIVDVRYNPGGMLTSVVQILDDILPEGLLVYIEDKYGNRQDYNSDGDTYLDCPIAVLMNENSASAAEIFAGAIKDYDYGTLIGTTTYGKGIVQTIFPLENGDAVKITTAKYFTPKGNDINKKGITPDVEAELSGDITDWTELTHKEDTQLQTALKEIGQS